jgi:hypothetical protein
LESTTDFHDTDRYWDGERLTAEGDGAVVNLLATWSGGVDTIPIESEEKYVTA